MIKRNGKFKAAVAAAVASLMLLSGCGGGTQTAAKTGTAVADTITAQVAYASRDFSPSTTSGALPMAANWHVTEPLYALDYSTYEPYAALAKGDPGEGLRHRVRGHPARRRQVLRRYRRHRQ